MEYQDTYIRGNLSSESRSVWLGVRGFQEILYPYLFLFCCHKYIFRILLAICRYYGYLYSQNRNKEQFILEHLILPTKPLADLCFYMFCFLEHLTQSTSFQGFHLCKCDTV